MTYELELLQDIRNLMWSNNIATWAGAFVALTALVVAIIALIRSRK